MNHQFYKTSEARKKSPVVSRPDLVAKRNAELSREPAKVRFNALDPEPTDNRIFFRRPDLSCYAVLTPGRVDELRKRKKLDAFLNRERESGVIIPTHAPDDPYRLGTVAGDSASIVARDSGVIE